MILLTVRTVCLTVKYCIIFPVFKLTKYLTSNLFFKITPILSLNSCHILVSQSLVPIVAMTRYWRIFKLWVKIHWCRKKHEKIGCNMLYRCFRVILMYLCWLTSFLMHRWLQLYRSICFALDSVLQVWFFSTDWVWKINNALIESLLHRLHKG